MHIKLQVVGWGATDNAIIIKSPILMEAFLSYIDQTTCRKMYSDGYEEFVDSDKFCAGSTSGNFIINKTLNTSLTKS